MTMRLLKSPNSHHLDNKKRYQFDGEIKWNLKSRKISVGEDVANCADWI